ncbi:uncharacterized protein Z520_02608 [Fonsecaea multimorphosa CBS 102226]|uniref:Uracil-DNA glycosylase-like domain-containing protein n=1 Tax=Fonsecaea multimorphosa CBS 102226 TaxID=1442371 RepID=A0A0D2L0F5_9EURO|nr:uncharacterized protein Z520_02608 [Fonsecaea multimorphosa CBS 102226]KIY02469.1 hypothetical protein Z520_02608 [Fonsecaea multimorphosa CBS 102226]OAL29108.1 hypothetical protein AYO22_02545 [Fonsecaea multimorphosa]
MEDIATLSDETGLEVLGAEPSMGATAFMPPNTDFAGSTFKARMEQFKYSPLKQADTMRRSPRLASPRAFAASKAGSASPSPRKRLRLQQHDQTEEDGENTVKQEEDSLESNISTAPKLKKRRSTTKERASKDLYNPVNNLVDSLRPGLTLVCIGLNPGLMTAATGHAYAHPSNRFWHLLHTSGITPKKHLPSETRDLMDLYQIGNTNICVRPTRSGDGLSKQEMEEGAIVLDKKIALYKPEAVVIVGKGIWEAIWMAKKGQKKFNDPDFHWGWQDEEMQLGRVWEDGHLAWPGAKTFVATSTSGLAATLTPAEKLAIWRPLGDWMTAKRKESEAASGKLVEA